MFEQLESKDIMDLLETAQRDQLDHYLEHVNIVAEKFFPTSFGELKKTLRFITDFPMANMPPAKNVDLVSSFKTLTAENSWKKGSIILSPQLQGSSGHSSSCSVNSRRDKQRSRGSSVAFAYPDSFLEFLSEVLQFMSHYGDIQVDCAPVSGTAFIQLQVANVHSNTFAFDKDGFDNQFPGHDEGRDLVAEELARDMPASPWKAICEIAAVMADISCGYAVANSSSSKGPYIMRFLLPCGTLL